MTDIQKRMCSALEDLMWYYKPEIAIVELMVIWKAECGTVNDEDWRVVVEHAKKRGFDLSIFEASKCV